MRKFLKFAGICLCVFALIWTVSVLANRKTLNDGVIRFHVVANSDSQEDQSIKLQVKDAVVAYLEDAMAEFGTVEEAKNYLSSHLAQVEAVANDTLTQIGAGEKVAVTLDKECFDTRHYDTFSLPAGVYESLRITIGSGEGRNWWCVVFPTLCAEATGEAFRDTATGSGFDDSLTGALQGEKPYQIRFFFLDVLGQIQKFFHR